MKIAIEATTIGFKNTGTNRFLRCLIDELEYTGNEINYFGSDYKIRLPKFMPDSIKRHYYRQFILKKEIEKSNSDCAIFPDYFMSNGFNKPAAIVIHDLSFITHPQFYSKRFVNYYTYQVKKTIEQNPLILTVSHHTKFNIIKHLNVKEKNIHIVQAYTKMKHFNIKQYSEFNEDLPYLLYVGHIEPRKNLLFLVEGFLEWKRKFGINIRLKIVGELWIKSDELLGLMSKHKNNPDIEFMGYISDENLEKLYKGACGFLHTSFEEGFGFPVLEAMNYNLPLICTEGIATAEISSPFSITINPYDKSSYYDGLNKLYDLVMNDEKPPYKIKYSPELMRNQLSGVLNELEFRMKKHSGVFIPKAVSNEEALIKTLVYSGMFNSGIKKDKIHEQLFDRKITKEDLNLIINKYLAENIIIESNGYLKLNYVSDGFYNKHNGRIEKKKLKKLLGFLNKLPLISLIAFSGGTSQYGIENHNDIDLFIISKPYAVYIVYFIIHVFSFLVRARKELCANYLIDESNLEIGQNYDYYTAHQIVTLKGFRNNKMLSHFCSRNLWIKTFFPNFNIIRDNYKPAGNLYYLIRPFNWIIMFLYKMKYKNLLKSKSLSHSIIITENCLKLHSNDNRGKIMNEFHKKWKDYRNRKLGNLVEIQYLVVK
jgi:glycosyltransferase involved in cell wall biosynthesis